MTLASSAALSRGSTIVDAFSVGPALVGGGAVIVWNDIESEGRSQFYRLPVDSPTPDRATHISIEDSYGKNHG